MIYRNWKITSCKWLLWPFVLLAPVVYGQEASWQNLPERFAQYQSKVLQEKLFVHTDKDFYLAGEMLWCKLYYVEGTTHWPLDISKVAYLEVLDRTGQPVLQTKIALGKGTGHGSLLLPKTLPTGHYTLRAYTNWMKNFGPDHFFEKKLTLVNTLAAAVPGEAVPTKTSDYDVQFFPEGGHLVQGLESKVAFRAVDEKGKGISFKGFLVNGQNDTLARFEPLRFGIGTFTFTPVAGANYRVVLRPAGGKALSRPLPQIQKTGYTMKLEEQGTGRIKITVSAAPGWAARAEQVYLFGHTRQIAKVAAAASLATGTAVFLLNKADLDDGITSFTIFDQAQQPLCERLYFKNPEKVLTLSGGPESGKYPSRQKVNVHLQANLPLQRPAAAANLSVSIYKQDVLQGLEENHLLGYLFLTSDLKGAIEAPASYFGPSTPENDQALDNLMLTHGWRRIKWEDIQQAKAPAFSFAPEYEGFLVKATVTPTTAATPVAQVPVFLSVPDTLPLLYGGLMNQKGEVQFSMHAFTGKREIIWQTVGAPALALPVLQNPYFEGLATNPLPGLQLQPQVQEALLSHSMHAQVQQLFQPDHQTGFARLPPGVNSPFYGEPDKRYVLQDYTAFPTMEDVFREYIIEVLVRKQEQQDRFFALDKPNGTYFEKEPLVLLDGVPVFTTGQVLKYNAAHVKKVELMNRPFYLGPFTFNGIVSLSTHAGNLPGFELDPNAVIFDYEGLQVQREFFAPVYETNAQTESKLPDFRNVLHWQPNLTTNATGEAHFSFYTSDKKGTYVGVVQGLGEQGHAGYHVFTFEVTEAL